MESPMSSALLNTLLRDTASEDPAEEPDNEPTATLRPLHPELATPTSAATSRLFAYFMTRFLHRAEYVRRSIYGNDVDVAIIAETIAVGAIEPYMRSQEFRERHSDIRSIVGTESQRGINAFSIAAATGIPRETVRRKIKQLISLGVVVEKEPSLYVIHPGFLQSSPVLGMLKEIETALMLFLSNCHAEALLKPACAQSADTGPGAVASAGAVMARNATA
jgi:hypothetical protein